ncbi:MAG: hypothetical protein ACOC85_01575 [Thermoplasmatota archaeon]
MTNITFGICGDLDYTNTPSEKNPLPTLRKEEVGKAIFDINASPISKGDLLLRYPYIYEDIDKLLKLNVLKEKKGKIYVNFTVIDKEDEKLIFEKCEKYADDLKERLKEGWADIPKILDRYQNKNVSKEKLAFMIVGCYFLDWGSLELFRKWDVCDHMKTQPGGNKYLLWGEHSDIGELKEIYWGGHMYKDEKYIFHNFGDHDEETIRNAFPDILHRTPDLDFEGGEEYRSLLFEKKIELARDIGDFIDLIGKEGIKKKYLLKRDNAKKADKIFNLLKKMRYIEEKNGEVYLSIPYFTPEDKDMIIAIVTRLIPILKGWLEENIDKLKMNLSEIKPIVNGIPFEEFFVQLWHYVFGLTNKKLAEDGIIFDTYSEVSNHKGYLPALFKGNVLEEVEEELINSMDNQ